MALRDHYAAGRRPAEPAAPQVLDQATDLLQGHPVGGLRGTPWCQCPFVGSELGVGAEIQLRVVQEVLDTLQWETSLTSFSDDGQDSISSTHPAITFSLEPSNNLLPFAL